MKNKNLVSYSLSIWLSWILGGIAIIAGGLIIFVAFAAWEPVKESLVSISEGIYSARSAVEFIGKDFGTSSSLVTDVSSSIRSTSEVIHETWITINSIKESTEDVRYLTLSVAQSIEKLPSPIQSLIGEDHFTEVLSNLENTYSESGQTIVGMEHLSVTLQPMEPLLEEVANGVDSLAGDLFNTEEAFSEAVDHLEKAAEKIESAAHSSVLPLIAAGTGLIPLLVGLYLIIQGAALRRLYLDRPLREETD
ncbi:MAG: hypothetical protein KAW14_10550 [Candidatus Aegiribacteria sp.]|nr:hypothetical protein [Candidatus Aegiribacteria sp.]